MFREGLRLFRLLFLHYLHFLRFYDDLLVNDALPVYCSLLDGLEQIDLKLTCSLRLHDAMRCNYNIRRA